MELVPAKRMKVGKQYYTRIGRGTDRVVVVKIIRTHVRKYAYVRRVGSRRILPKLRMKLDLWVRK